MGKNDNQRDIHDRHSVPGDESDEKAPAPKSDKPNFSWPGEDPQAVRDSFYKENGVKDDLTGGKVPGEE